MSDIRFDSKTLAAFKTAEAARHAANKAEAEYQRALMLANVKYFNTVLPGVEDVTVDPAPAGVPVRISARMPDGTMHHSIGRGLGHWSHEDEPHTQAVTGMRRLVDDWGNRPLALIAGDRVCRIDVAAELKHEKIVAKRGEERVYKVRGHDFEYRARPATPDETGGEAGRWIAERRASGGEWEQTGGDWDGSESEANALIALALTLAWDTKSQKIVSVLLDAGEALIRGCSLGPTRFWMSTDAYWTTFVDKKGHGYALADADGIDVFRPDKERFATRAEALEACQLVALDHMHLSDADAKKLMTRLRAETTKAHKTNI